MTAPAAKPPTTAQTKTAKTPGALRGANDPATAASAHAALIAFAILLLFVYLMVLIAGVSRGAGRIAVVTMLSLLVIQGVTHVSPFVAFIGKHPLTPTSPPPITTA